MLEIYINDGPECMVVTSPCREV